MSILINSVLKNKFIKNSILYTVGSMMTPMIGFILLPIYTGYLSPAEYGIMTTVQTLVGMLQLFLLLSLNGAVTRFFYDFLEEPQKQKEFLGSIFTFVLCFSTIIALILYFFSDSIGSLLFKNIPINPFYSYLIGLSWLSALLALPLALFRAQEKAGLFVSVNIIKALLIMGLTVYLIIGKGLGAEGALISQLIVTFIVVLFTFGWQFKLIKFSLNSLYIKQSLLFSLPLLPHVASVWIISSSDRIILEKFISIEDLGIYALAAQVSMVLALFYTSVNNALVPRYVSLLKEGNEIKAKRLLKAFSYIVLIFGITSIPVAMYALNFFASNQYNGAVSLIPFLLIGQIVKGFYFIPAAKLFYSKKTKVIATSSTIAAVSNILINFITIPLIGIYGAIVSTIVAEVLRVFFVYRGSNRL
ncbi:oligosaccharide flippase family protein [Aquibacillus koreensis]|uniref:Oligosaccharide flippase family protein n=1 Tax=Aquibacillus koreensis TaxID=279446 RepID=A0A9X4AHL4_9BACI|nr:oligosaccharide flippase family protein [Aquibacillus koreensis]MCT2534645.1 oligosaccharide flippase family protein [Aquibacillus koreensis]MDC3419829.1 oligosaccharide flippase family protein [Aquibacillus koreensis]